jgi:hypothetical protein
MQRRMLAAPLLATALLVPAMAGEATAGGAFLPPLELEVGRASIDTPEGGGVLATQMMVGISWASVYPKRTAVDFSIGWMGSFVEDADPSMSIERRIEVENVDDASGVFMDFGWRAAQGTHWRAWIGGRGELLYTDETGVLGAFGRVSTELWAPVAISGSGGGMIGTFAISAWAEVGARERPDRSVGQVVAVGVGIRLPLVGVR